MVADSRFSKQGKICALGFPELFKGNYTEGLSDAPRVLSFKAGGSIVQQHPLLGTGAGDVLHDAEEWYAEHAGFLKPYERLLPSNEYYTMPVQQEFYSGLLAFCIFLYPFFMKDFRHYFSWISFPCCCFDGIFV
jgi:hypothetical protein